MRCRGLYGAAAWSSGNKQAGDKLGQMLALGTSKPWPEAMQALTGRREIDASAIIDYFAPLMAWLEEQIKAVNVVGSG